MEKAKKITWKKQKKNYMEKAKKFTWKKQKKNYMEKAKKITWKKQKKKRRNVILIFTYTVKAKQVPFRFCV